MADSFKVCIFGSRDFFDLEFLTRRVDSILEGFPKHSVTIISGGARGADKMGECYAAEHMIPYNIYRANWDKYGKSAGYRRNAEMAEVCDAAIGFWDGTSKGTKHMIDLCKDKDKPVFVERF